MLHVHTCATYHTNTFTTSCFVYYNTLTMRCILLYHTNTSQQVATLIIHTDDALHLIKSHRRCDTSYYTTPTLRNKLLRLLYHTKLRVSPTNLMHVFHTSLVSVLCYCCSLRNFLQHQVSRPHSHRQHSIASLNRNPRCSHLQQL
jgi:hypothetical protein